MKSAIEIEDRASKTSPSEGMQRGFANAPCPVLLVREQESDFIEWKCRDSE